MIRMPVDLDSKIRTLPELKLLLHSARERGLKIAFANGCFDLIHVGHVRYLQGAKTRGDILVVALNSDASVSAIKGPRRPLQAEAARAEMIASMQCVDYVVIFDDPTVDNLLKELRPDVHAKGTDYTADSVPERETVRSYGGQVAIVGDSKAHSTRDLIEVILSKFRS
jgi:D-glycero-beta-D-manno-heptose 1-phosphate adenylyltransferase